MSTNPEKLADLYTEYKPLLFTLAYRMLGSVSDAEDIVQDTFMQVQHRVSLEQVKHIKAYLCKITTHRCLDKLRSAQKQRESYIGPWLPEPLIADQLSPDPAQQYEQNETISFAMLTLIETLTPVERAVFILREAFDMPYEDIAEMLEKKPDSIRKILSRLRPKLKGIQPMPSPQEADPLIQQFLYAAQTGDMEGMLSLLAEDARLYSDGGGKVSAATKPIVSRENILRFLAGLGQKQMQQPEVYRAIPAIVNDSIGLIILESGQVSSVFAFQATNMAIQTIYIVRNPDKLTHLSGRSWF